MSNDKNTKKFDLEERTAKFGEAVMKFRMIVITVSDLRDEAKTLWQEAKELNLIFNSIYKRVK